MWIEGPQGRVSQMIYGSLVRELQNSASTIERTSQARDYYSRGGLGHENVVTAAVHP